MVLRLGDVTFGLGADSTDLQRAVTQMQGFARLVNQTAKAQVDGAAAAAAAMARQEQAIHRSLQTLLNFNAAAERVKAPAALTQEATRAFQDLTAYLTQGTVDTISFARAQDLFTASIGKSRRALQDFKSAATETRNTKLLEYVRDLQSASVLAVGPLSGLGARIGALAAITSRSAFAMAGMLAGVTLTAVGLYKLGQGAVEAATNIQRIQAALTAATGSVAAANVEFDYATKISQKYGLDLNQVAKEYAQLTAATANTSLAGEGTRKVFEGVAAAASALHLSGEQVAGTINALQQMASKGTVAFQELHQQLGNQIPGAMALAAEAMGLTQSELNKLVSTGQVAASDLLPRLGAVLLKHFGQDGVQAADSLQGAINRLNTAVLLFNRNFDSAAGISDKYKGSLQTLADAILYLSQHMDGLLSTVGKLGGLILGLALPSMISGVVRLIPLIGSLTGAVVGLNAAMLANPAAAVGAILARTALAAAGLIAGWAAMSSGVADVTDKTRELTDQVDEYIKKAKEQGHAVKATTDDLVNSVIRQIQAQAVLLDSLQNPTIGNRIRDFFKGAFAQLKDTLTFDWSKVPLTNNQQINAAKTALDGLIDRLQSLRQVATGLAGENTLSKAFESALKQVQKLSIEAKAAKQAVDDLKSGKSVETAKQDVDLGKANEMLRNVPSKELGEMLKNLQQMGYSGDSAAAALAKMITALRNYKDDIRDAGERQKTTNNALDDYNRKLQELRMQLDAMQKGPKAYEAFKLQKQQMDQFAQLKKELTDHTNLPASDVDARMAKLLALQQAIQATLEKFDKLKQAEHDTERATKEIDKLGIQAQAAKEAYEAITSGQGTASAKIMEDLGKAQDILKNLPNDKLAEIQKHLADMGYNGKTAADALQQLITALRTYKESTRDFENRQKTTNNALEEYRRKLLELQQQFDALQKGPKAYSQYLLNKQQMDQAAQLRKLLTDHTNLSPDQINGMMQKFQDLQDRVKGAQEGFLQLKEVGKEAVKVINDGFDEAGKTIADAFINGSNAMQGFRSLLKNIGDEVVQFILKITLLNTLKRGIFGVLSEIGLPLPAGTPLPTATAPTLPGLSAPVAPAAPMVMTALKGLALTGRHVRMLARGGLTTSPTFLAGGSAMSSEFGQTEGVFPLQRDASGNLGVRGAMAAPTTNIYIQNNGDTKASASRKRNQSGGEDITITFDRMVAQAVQTGGRTIAALNKTFNLRPAVAPR